MSDPAPGPTEVPAPGDRSRIGVIFLVLFLDLVGFSILFPLYPDMLAYYGEHDTGLMAAIIARIKALFPHAGPVQIAALFGGVLGGFYSLLQFLVAPFWGKLSDRIGRRPVMLIALSGSLAAYACWVFASDFTVLLVSRLLAGLLGGAAVVANAAVADLTATPQARARAMGLVGMAFGLGFILGPVIGWLTHAYLPNLDGHGAFAGWGLHPFSNTALFACALSAVNLVWAVTHFRETLPAELRGNRTSDRTANPLRLFSGGLGHGVVSINVAFLLHTALFAGMESTIGFLTDERLGFGPNQLGPLFAAMGFTAALMQGLVFRRLAPCVGAKPLVIAGLILLIPGFLLVGAVDLWPSRTLLMVGIVVLSCGTGLVFPGMTTLLSLAADARNQGLAMGTFRSAGSLGRAIGPLLAAVVYFAWSPAGPYLVGAVGMVVPLTVIALMRPRL
ncbi:MAG: MFS transporter [Planctomycetes bacterium]|nr:MFS transporter [Planctomycetota bacterium]